MYPTVACAITRAHCPPLLSVTGVGLVDVVLMELLLSRPTFPALLCPAARPLASRHGCDWSCPAYQPSSAASTRFENGSHLPPPKGQTMLALP